MWKGASALNNIDKTLQTIRNEVVRLDTQLTKLTEKLTQNQRHRMNLINDIAKVRLYEIDQGSLQREFSAADLQAAEILKQRKKALAKLNDLIDKLNQKIHDAEVVRKTMLDKVNQQSLKITDKEAQVQTTLSEDKNYLDFFEKAKIADSVAKQAHSKADTAKHDMAEKATPYQQDKLFMYLWNRKFGTSDYKSGLITRWLDGWVAGLIRYEPARINYWNLQEIPQRLTQHADQLANLADEAHMALQELELAALKKAGVPNMENKLNKLRDKLDAHDDAIESDEKGLNDSLQQRAEYTSGDDEYIQRCLQRLTQALDHQDLSSIHSYVRETASFTDDKLLIELQQVDHRHDEVTADLADIRVLQDKKAGRLQDLEQVRRDFKDNRFDDVRSGFGNKHFLLSILGQFLQGIVNGDELWQVLRRNQRYQDVASLPDFGSGGLGDLFGSDRQSRNSSWNWPKPRRGGGGFNFPSGLGGGGGGFRTGGGF